MVDNKGVKLKVIYVAIIKGEYAVNLLNLNQNKTKGKT